MIEKSRGGAWAPKRAEGILATVALALSMGCGSGGETPDTGETPETGETPDTGETHPSSDEPGAGRPDTPLDDCADKCIIGPNSSVGKAAHCADWCSDKDNPPTNAHMVCQSPSSAEGYYCCCNSWFPDQCTTTIFGCNGPQLTRAGAQGSAESLGLGQASQQRL